VVKPSDGNMQIKRQATIGFDWLAGVFGGKTCQSIVSVTAMPSLDSHMINISDSRRHAGAVDSKRGDSTGIAACRQNIIHQSQVHGPTRFLYLRLILER
jgi:hypothetical protein